MRDLANTYNKADNALDAIDYMLDQIITEADVVTRYGVTARDIFNRGFAAAGMGEFIEKQNIRTISDLEHYLLNVRGLVLKGAPIKDFWSVSEFYLDRAKQNNFVSPEVQKLSVGGYLGVLAKKADDFIDGSLGIQNGGFLDKVTDILTAAGQVIDGFSRAGTAVGQGFQNARDLFAKGDLVGAIGAAAGGIVNGLGEVAAGIGRGIGEVAGAIADAAIGAVEAVGSAIGGAMDAAFGRDPGHDGQGSDNGKPVIIDLDGDGIEISVNGQVSFDMDADGYKERTAWADADDGFLVVDFAASGKLSDASDGRITQTKELVLTEILGLDEITDLQALAIMEKNAAYGGNNDGVLNASDALWQKLKVWQDKDQDGEVDAGEMKTLDAFGIRQINLKYDDGASYSDLKNDVPSSATPCSAPPAMCAQTAQ